MRKKIYSKYLSNNSEIKFNQLLSIKKYLPGFCRANICIVDRFSY